MRRCLAVFVVAICLTAACGKGKDSAPRADTATNTTATGELTFFNPTRLPAGYKVAEASMRSEAQEAATWSAKLGRPNGAGKFRDVLTVVVSEAGEPTESDGDTVDGDTVDVNGHAARVFDSPIAGTGVSWTQDGFDIGVIGPAGKQPESLAAARALRVNPDATQTRLETLPAGYEVIAQWGSNGFPDRGYSISAERTDKAGTIESIRIAVTLVPTDFPVAILGAGYETDATSEVRGHEAIVFRMVNDIGGRAFEQVTLGWGERPDLSVTISGSVGIDELRSVATGLRAESESEWRSHVPVK